MSALEIAQRAIVLHLLDPEHPRPWARSELQAALDDIEPSVLAAALTQLSAVGVLRREHEHVRATLATRRLEALGMISI